MPVREFSAGPIARALLAPALRAASFPCRDGGGAERKRTFIVAAFPLDFITLSRLRF
jgi:hypothetical protein